jgi:hypothetical protein
MKSVYELYWLFAVIYAYVFWGPYWALLSLIMPYAPIYDLVVKLGRIE